MLPYGKISRITTKYKKLRSQIVITKVSKLMVSLSSAKVIWNYRTLLMSCLSRYISTMFTFKNLIIFSILQALPSSVFISLQIVFFLVSLHQGHSSRQYLIVSVWFPNFEFWYVGCWSFFVLSKTLSAGLFPMEGREKKARHGN